MFVDPVGRNSMSAMATMPRHQMHHISNGNGGLIGGQQWTGSPPPPPPPPHHGSVSGSILGLASGSSATLPVKKKSVTIGTFTTVMEPFEISEVKKVLNFLLCRKFH